LISFVAMLSGCIAMRSSEGPMRILEDRLACTERPSTLIVFLPGIREVPEDIVREGFVKELRDRNIQADMQILDSHYGYFKKLEIVDRLEKEVMLLARAKGYSNVWFVGISLGGFGTLIHGASQAKLPNANPKLTYDGFFVMAPYMGEKRVWSKIQEAGFEKWQAPTESDFSVDLWRWLANYTKPKQSALPNAYIGYGTEDSLMPPNRLFGSILPQDRHLQVAGGHDWPPWKALWAQWLDKAPLARSASASQLCKF
jgi:hypothetical protein